MERTFTRATRSHMQPVEIGKRLVRAMERDQSVGVDGVEVPNVYDVHLSPIDFEHFRPQRRSFTEKLEAHVARSARQRRFVLASRPRVYLAEDRSLDPGDIRVDAHKQDIDLSPAREREHTAVLPRVDSDLPLAPVVSAPMLNYDGGSFAVLHSPTKVGRLPDNDIVFNDPRVSRHHAQLVEQNGRWILRDTGSTNGTAVNGKIVREAALRPGDAISLGGLEVTWEQ
jgi:Protein of unknown function (DUF3662)/FHA domain